MSDFYHSVYVNKDNCMGCVTCMKRCPTSAIRVHNKKAEIIANFCIDCGVCVKHCPHSAELCRRNNFTELREKYKYLVALPDPALYSQFNNLGDIDILLTAIKLSGFDDVMEISAAAELLTEAIRSYVMENRDKWPLISTACPTIQRLIRVRFPNMIDHLLPYLPPMEVAAEMGRGKAVKDTGLAPEEIGMILISPCPSKIAYIHQPIGIEKSNIDGAIAVKDYYKMLLPYLDEAVKAPQKLSASGKAGKNWAVGGGEASMAKIDTYLAADGIENVISVLEDLEDEKFEPGLMFAELNACSPGCVGGVLNAENPYMAKTKIKKLCKEEPESRMSRENTGAYDMPCLESSVKMVFSPVYRLGENIFESMENMQKVEDVLRLLPKVDCGSCGAPSCRALAEDIVTNMRNAKREDCVFYLRSRYNQEKKRLENEE